MIRLERLRADHAPALLAFERENRAYFARSIPDRGDAYFAGFASIHEARLAEQETGGIHFHVVLDGSDSSSGSGSGLLIGRANLVDVEWDVERGTAEVGYRIGERAAGRGVATAAVAALCGLAATTYGLSSLTARTTLDNPASRTVLERNGFVFVEEVAVGGRPGVRYERRL
ncbi:GNAT family N-acetyltransferase [Streptomyces hesseae]|uniref:GNAT family N-acetyltransferase n=1 Tax=Streptomyces hesseae TaxID=3075519 RepID=A0ABU2SP57_9ACTN|nr:GNAT family N-acetyltransferase [Streptomyces sp. DSM 40473]MDT0450773.1 GNAT family N-acetyltransferase [Streptomyces sp. DSM 40473]